MTDYAETSVHETDYPEQVLIETIGWNAEGCLNDADQEKQEAALRVLVRHRELQLKLGRLGIIFLSEACGLEDESPLDNVQGILHGAETSPIGETIFEKAKGQLEGMGLVALSLNQDTSEPGRHWHDIMMLVDGRLLSDGEVEVDGKRVRLGLEKVRLVSRYAIKATLFHPEMGRVFEVYGSHLPDKSEAAREAEVHAETEQYERDSATNELLTPTIVLGDKNTVRPDSFKARLLRTALRPIVNRLPAEYPTTKSESLGWRQKINVAQRACDMAFGAAYRCYLEAGLVNTDPGEMPTAYQGLGRFLDKLGLRFGLKIDQTFYSEGDFEVVEHTVTKETMISKDGRKVEISDHRPEITVLRMLPAKKRSSQIAA